MGACASSVGDEVHTSSGGGTMERKASAASSPSEIGIFVDPQHVDVAANLKTIPLLNKLSQQELLQLAGAMQTRSYRQGECLMKEGDEGDSFYIIKSGTCDVLKYNAETEINHPIAELRPRDYCGESTLLNNHSKCGATIISSSVDGTTVYTLDRTSFISLFGENKKLNINFSKRAAISAETQDRFSRYGGGAGMNGQFSTKKYDASSTSNSKAYQSATMPSGARQSKTPEEMALITGAIAKNILFTNLSNAQREAIMGAMWFRQVAAEEDVIKEGDLGDYFYVVQSGHFDVYQWKEGQQKKVDERDAGRSFGELALMYNAPRNATVKARVPCTVWCVDRWTFRRVVSQVQDAKLHEYEEFLSQVHSFEVLLDNERARIAEAIEEVSYPKGAVIVRQGEPGDTLFIIKSGDVVVTQKPPNGGKEVELIRYHPGGFFGERALLKDEPRAATCTALTDVVCLYLNRDAFSILMGSMEDIFLQRIEGYTKGNADDALASLSAANATGNRDGSFFRKSKMLLEQEKAQADKKVQSSSTSSDGTPDYLDHSLKLSDLIVVGTLGRGSFGLVQLVKHQHTRKTYALKTVGKQQVVQLGQQEHIMSEKRTMAALNHPFLVRLYATFQSKDALYFVLEPSLGGELFSVLRTHTHFDEHVARFYAAGVILAFDYMHSQGIVYRDLKPENLLLDEKGYLKITDFGFAKKVGDGRTWTLCGTPDYLSPEVVSGAGHGKGVDWWTLGVLIYEMLASYPPFYDEEPMKTYAKIMQASPPWPLHFSRAVIDLLKGLLYPKPTKRLGVIQGGAAAIKSHAWFAGFDWVAFENRTMKAPIVLPVKDDEDLSNFEEYPQHEEWCVPTYTGDPKTPHWEKDF